MPPAKRRLEYMPVEDLVSAPVNPKEHADDDLDASVTRFGWLEPVVMDERTGKLLSGHGRRDALLRLRERNAAVPDGVVADKQGRWLLPVIRGWASRDDNDASAALIAVNRTVEKGGWRPDELFGLLDDLAKSERGLEGIGFTPDDLDALAQLMDVPPNLDDLADGIGEPGERDFWPVLRLTVSPDTKQRWDAYALDRDPDEVVGTLLDGVT